MLNSMMVELQDRDAGGTNPTTLAVADARRLTEFARACKAAVRAVALYPERHPGIAAPLNHLVALTAPVALQAPLRISVLTDVLLVGHRAPAQPDAAIAELAALLHSHLIGELTVH